VAFFRGGDGEHGYCYEIHDDANDYYYELSYSGCIQHSGWSDCSHYYGGL